MPLKSRLELNVFKGIPQNGNWIRVWMWLKNQIQFAYRSENRNVVSILREKDAIFVPTGSPHSFWNVGNEDCTFLVIKSPPFFLEEIPLDPAIEKIKLFRKK